MRDRIATDPQYKDIQLLAIDPHEHWAAKYLLNEVNLAERDVDFPLLTDPSLTVSAAYGVAMQMRIHVEHSNRPTTFIVDKQGVLRFEHRAETFSDRPSADDVLNKIDELRGG